MNSVVNIGSRIPENECLSATKQYNISFRKPPWRDPEVPTEILLARWNNIAYSRETQWLKVITEMGQTALWAFAWKTSTEQVTTEKYGDNPEIGSYLENAIDSKEFVWLDEVFGDDEVMPEGKLELFPEIIQVFMSQFNARTIAYRTIAPAMVIAAVNLRQCGFDVKLYRGDNQGEFNTKEPAWDGESPDWRSMITISKKGEL